MQPAPTPLDASLYQPTSVDLTPSFKVPAPASLDTGVELPSVDGVAPNAGASQAGQSLLRQGATPAPASSSTAAAGAGMLESGLNGFSAALKPQTPTGSAPAAVMQGIDSGVEGAASGAAVGAGIGLVGGPVGVGAGAAIGAGVGGTVGLVVGGVNAFLGLQSARAQQRAREAQAEQISYWNQRSVKQNRQDYNDQTAYNRSTQANISQWAAYKDMGDKINSMVASDPKLQALYKNIMR